MNGKRSQVTKMVASAMINTDNAAISKSINQVFIKAPMNIPVLTKPSRYSFFQGLK